MNRWLKWDSLNVRELVEAALEGFSGHFYQSSFDALPFEERRRILAEIARVVKMIQSEQYPN